MKIFEFFPVLDQLAPLGYAEEWDNVGLIIGDKYQEVTNILVCHDALETVIDEAIIKNCNLIICFHPILFNGLKKITGKNYVERAVIKAISNNIAIYALHTALDNHQFGVNKIFCEQLGLSSTTILIPKQNFIRKLVTYAPNQEAEKVRNALFKAGAGKIGNYENCSFSSIGIGTYQGNEYSNPVIGNRLELVSDSETKIEVTFEKHLQSTVLKALFDAHIYEEVAYEITDLQNVHQNIGMGMIGDLKNAMEEKQFLEFVKLNMNANGIRHSQFLNKKVRKVAVLGGAGSFAIANAIAAGADAFLTADLKYHQFFEAENKMLLADIGHYESESYIKKHIVDFLSRKMSIFANNFFDNKIILSEINTNPVKYL